jgi:hypothetical protein
VRSSQHRSRVPDPLSGADGIVGSELVFSEVHHQVSLTIWHDSFQRRGQIRLVVMERLDERRQQRRKRFGGEGAHRSSLARTFLPTMQLVPSRSCDTSIDRPSSVTPRDTAPPAPQCRKKRSRSDVRRFRPGYPSGVERCWYRLGDGGHPCGDDCKWAPGPGPEGLVSQVPRLFSLLSEPSQSACCACSPDQHSSTFGVNFVRGAGCSPRSGKWQA